MASNYARPRSGGNGQSDGAMPPFSQQELRRWSATVRSNTIAHDYLSAMYKRRSRMLTLTEVLLNTIVTSAIFTTSNDSADATLPYFRWIAGAISMVVSITAGVKSALSYDQRHEQHRTAAVRFSKLWIRFDDLHRLRHVPYMASHAANTYMRSEDWTDWYKDYLDVMEAAPMVDSTTWRWVKGETVRGCCGCFSKTKQTIQLPVGWNEYFDEEVQKPYFHHKEHGVTWIRPQTTEMPPEPPALPQPRDCPGMWMPEESPSGAQSYLDSAPVESPSGQQQIVAHTSGDVNVNGLGRSEAGLAQLKFDRAAVLQMLPAALPPPPPRRLPALGVKDMMGAAGSPPNTPPSRQLPSELVDEMALQAGASFQQGPAAKSEAFDKVGMDFPKNGFPSPPPPRVEDQIDLESKHALRANAVAAQKVALPLESSQAL